MSAASQKGQKFERLIANWFRARLNDDGIDIRPKNGTNDRGDIGGVKTIRGGRVVLELKNHNRHELGVWLEEATLEAGNDDAPIGAVIFKRRGTANPAEQYVLMDAETFARLLEGGAWDEPVIVTDPFTEVRDA